MSMSSLQRARLGSVIRKEGPLPFSDLEELAGASEQALVRWAVKGRRGIRLEAYRDPSTREWFSSRAALDRFLTATAADDGGGNDAA